MNKAAEELKDHVDNGLSRAKSAVHHTPRRHTTGRRSQLRSVTRTGAASYGRPKMGSKGQSYFSKSQQFHHLLCFVVPLCWTGSISTFSSPSNCVNTLDAGSEIMNRLVFMHILTWKFPESLLQQRCLFIAAGCKGCKCFQHFIIEKSQFGIWSNHSNSITSRKESQKLNNVHRLFYSGYLTLATYAWYHSNSPLQ